MNKGFGFPNSGLLSKKDSTMKTQIANLTDQIKLLEARVLALETQETVTRDRGPKSERDMTEEDARQVILGELKDLSHKAAAEKLNLSYGQIYSARGGYTFKKVYNQGVEARKAK
jgi:hypothetical protein